MKSMTIGKRIVCGFAAVVAVTVALGGFAYEKLVTIDAATRSVVSDSLPGLLASNEMSNVSRMNYIRLVRHVNTDDAQEMAAIEADIEKLKARVGKAFKDYEDAITTPADRELFTKVQEVRPAFLEAFSHVTELSHSLKTEEARAAMRKQLDPAYKAYMDAVDATKEYNEANAKQSGQASLDTVATAKKVVVFAVSMAVVLAVAVAFFIVRSINTALTRMAATLGEGSEQVASASGQVSSGSQSLAQGASEQAAALEESTSALEEMASMTRKNAETAAQARQLSGEAQHAAGRGNDAMRKMGDAIAEIERSATETSKIIKTIDEIAFQTNLLALNAAVEAARAGEAGKGFAVVAEEVRNLAMRSAEAAKNTSALIEGSVQSSRNGVAIVAEVGKALGEIGNSVERVNGLVGEIAAASQEQSQGIGQINQSVAQMDQVTQSSAANAEESAAAAEELSGQAEQLQSVVRELVAMVGGAQSSTPAHAGGAPRRQPVASRPKTTAKAPTPTRVLKSKAAQAIPFDEDGATPKADGQDFSEFGKAA